MARDAALSTALRHSDAPSILQHLCRYEHTRQNTHARVNEVLLAIEQDWTKPEPWEHNYLVKVRQTYDHGATLFAMLDLSWRRNILERYPLYSQDSQQILEVLNAYFTLPIEPYNVAEYHLGDLGRGIDDFNRMIRVLLEDMDAPVRKYASVSADAASPIFLVPATKIYVQGVAASAARVKVLFDKYRPGPSGSDNRPQTKSQQSLAQSSCDDSTPRSSQANSPRSDRTRGKAVRGRFTPGKPMRAQVVSAKRKWEARDAGNGEQGTSSQLAFAQQGPAPASAAKNLPLPIPVAGDQSSRLESSEREIQTSSSPTKRRRSGSSDSSMMLASSPNPESDTNIHLEPADLQRAITAAYYAENASQFPQTEMNPTYLAHPTGPPSKALGRPEGPAPATHIGLPAGIRVMAGQNQAKLAKERRTISLSNEPADLVDEVPPTPGISDRSTRQQEPSDHHLRDQISEPRGNALAATNSSILMPPPPARTSQPTSSGENGAPSSSAPGEPSTLLSSPPHLDANLPDRPIEPVPTFIPASSLDEGEPSTVKSSQDYPLPTAAQSNPSGPSLDSFAESSDAEHDPTRHGDAAHDSLAQSESQSQSQADSQSRSQSQPRSQASDVSINTSNVKQPVPVAPGLSSPKILVPDTSDSSISASLISSSSHIALEASRSLAESPGQTKTRATVEEVQADPVRFTSTDCGAPIFRQIDNEASMNPLDLPAVSSNRSSTNDVLFADLESDTSQAMSQFPTSQACPWNGIASSTREVNEMFNEQGWISEREQQSNHNAMEPEVGSLIQTMAIDDTGANILDRPEQTQDQIATQSSFLDLVQRATEDAPEEDPLDLEEDSL
ncbi:uncharacterized protein JCM15063_003218 [Sporobolomyces koalae]|uniref:uncharacterized protein n=1 Tax=Sporobolomyces koalae TaxID=500713 RepID=UPI00316F5598